MCLEMFIMVCLEECLYLLGKEGKKFVGGLGLHKGVGDGDFGLLEGEGLVSMQDNAADSKIGPAEVDRKVDALSTPSDR